MIGKVLRKFNEDGLRGVCGAVFRKILNRDVHPMVIALDVITRNPGFSVIQLGAYIGNSGNDPLFKSLSRRLREVDGKLIVVEPVRSFYDELVKNYEGIPGVAFENVAISDQAGPAIFYRLGVDPVVHGYPEWLSQLGSLKEERMTELWDQYEADERLKDFYLKHRVQEIVECVTFQELTSRHGLAALDLLQMDVEGYELEILRTIDFGKFPVRFVNYESVLLHSEKPNAERLMAGWGYRLNDYGQDTFCCKESDMSLLAHLG